MEESILFQELTQDSETDIITNFGDINSIKTHNSVENPTEDNTSDKNSLNISVEKIAPQNEIMELNVMQLIKSQENLEQNSLNLNVPSTSKSNLEQDVELSLSSENESLDRKRKPSKCSETEYSAVKRKRSESIDSELESVDDEDVDLDQSGSEYVPSENEDSDEEYVPRKSPIPKTSNKTKVSLSTKIKKVLDDGDFENYRKRTKSIVNSHSDTSNDKKLDYHVKVPSSIWRKLYQYQKIGVKWMNELNHQKVGGLLGDEMGLGKTVQVIAFLAALDYSKTVYTGNKKGLGPSLIICPATVMHQWVKHFYDWWPPLRVAILHQSGSFKGRPHDLIREMNKETGILLTTYQGMLKYNKLLCELYWHYIVLDEGHKIRNPSAKVTEAIKNIQTPHRLVLTGSPMQNNLTELWSLFDFIVPGKLGTLQVFMDHFATPILQGGYANASPFQEATALSIATALKNVITPYMLRRAKVDVQIDLPSKNEQVLFCELTKEQLDLYKHYLMTDHVGTLLNKDHRLSNNMFRAKMLMAITVLRKICNHPDLYLGDVEDTAPNISKLPVEVPIEERYGYYKRSGKMRVVASLLKIWKQQGHRVLLFTQTRSMIEIFEEFLNINKYTYLKMDGTTSIGARQPLIERFNNDSEYFLFLLTTRVGGLGINLTGANRVIIYDPDWNPATDMQARERAWRIGQKKNVTVYRLLSAGTIEEKMYQRQVWKQLLSNKVLSNAKQKRFFKLSDLHELFSLVEPNSNANIETLNIFQDAKAHESKLDTSVKLFSEEKLKAMKELAQKLAKNMGSTSKTSTENPETSKQIELKSSESLQISANDYEKEDENFIWDPTTIRFRKMRKIIIPTETVPKNLVNETETNISFNEILEKLETAKTLDIIDFVPTQNESPNMENKLEQETTELKNANLDKNNQGKMKETLTASCTDDKPNNNTNLKTKKSTEKLNNHLKSVKKKHHKSDGVVDGEIVQGVIKKERFSKLTKDENVNFNEKQDAYVLQQLFSRGVHTALKHDSIVRSEYEGKHSLKDRIEAERKAKSALKALKSTRLRKWRW